MITIQTLTATGSIDALLTLANGSAMTARQVSEYVDVSLGTTRTRLNALAEEGLVTTDAEMIDGQPTMVYVITDEGLTVAEGLDKMLAEEYDTADAAYKSPVDESELAEE